MNSAHDKEKKQLKVSICAGKSFQNFKDKWYVNIVSIDTLKDWGSPI